jgi:nucleotide-binding universal stress UspA family protein
MDSHDPWIVGLDLNLRSRGALVFAAWLQRVGQVPLVGVHMLEAWVRALTEEDPAPALRAAATRLATAAGIPAFDQLQVRTVEEASEGLVESCAAASGLVIGRAAERGSSAVVRLGRVARRVLRRLPCPVVVVPPDLSAVGVGPILLATDLGPASNTAARFAAELAVRCGHTLELIHVVDDRSVQLIDVFQAAWAARRDASVAAAEAAVTRWAGEHLLGAATRHVRTGNPVDVIAETAAARRAALVVVGSRRLSTAMRYFSTSTASELAATATCPVCVVPPVDRDARRGGSVDIEV